MKIKKNLSAALDCSGGAAHFVLAETVGRKVLARHSRTVQRQEASGLVPWLVETSAGAGYELGDIGEWTIGLGPGSFTGIRMAAAFALGLAAADGGVRVRGLPSAFAVAAEFAEPDGLVTVIYPGRGDFIAFGVGYGIDGQYRRIGVEVVVAGEEFDPPLGEGAVLAAAAADREKLADLLPGELFEGVAWLGGADFGNLLFINYQDWDAAALLDPEYARAATKAAPLISGRVVDSG